MSSATEREFDDTYGLVKKKQETRQQFLTRVVEKVNKTSDDDWEKLTADAQRWFNAAVKAWDAEKTIPDFPDAEPESEPEQTDEEANDEDQGADVDAADEPADDEREDDMAARKKRAAKKRAAPPAKKKVVHAAANGKLAVSGSSIVKRALLKKMNQTDKELAEVLKKRDFKLSPVRISLIKAEFRHTMRLLQEDGRLKDQYKF